MLGVEADSFLPNDQRDRCNFAGQRETRHLRPDSLGHQSSVKFLERPGLGGGYDGFALENVFELVIVIAVEPAQRYLPLRWSQLPFHITMIGAAVRLDGKTAVSPQLPLGAEAMRCLQNRDQLGCTDRPNRGDLAQQFRRLVFRALGQQLAPHLLPQRTQLIELLVVELRPAAHTRFADLAEPLRAIARRIDLLAAAGNRPTAIHRLEPRHHPSQIAADRQITARQFLQGSYAVLAVIDRRKISPT